LTITNCVYRQRQRRRQRLQLPSGAGLTFAASVAFAAPIKSAFLLACRGDSALSLAGPTPPDLHTFPLLSLSVM
jgi:hypothetical protein